MAHCFAVLLSWLMFCCAVAVAPTSEPHSASVTQASVPLADTIERHVDVPATKQSTHATSPEPVAHSADPMAAHAATPASALMEQKAADNSEPVQQPHDTSIDWKQSDSAVLNGEQHLYVNADSAAMVVDGTADSDTTPTPPLRAHTDMNMLQRTAAHASAPFVQQPAGANGHDSASGAHAVAGADDQSADQQPLPHANGHSSSMPATAEHYTTQHIAATGVDAHASEAQPTAQLLAVNGHQKGMVTDAAPVTDSAAPPHAAVTNGVSGPAPDVQPLPQTDDASASSQPAQIKKRKAALLTVKAKAAAVAPAASNDAVTVPQRKKVKTFKELTVNPAAAAQSQKKREVKSASIQQADATEVQQLLDDLERWSEKGDIQQLFMCSQQLQQQLLQLHERYQFVNVDVMPSMPSQMGPQLGTYRRVMCDTLGLSPESDEDKLLTAAEAKVASGHAALERTLENYKEIKQNWCTELLPECKSIYAELQKAQANIAGTIQTGDI